LPTHEFGWEDLAASFRQIEQSGERLRAEWSAYEGSEDYGIWVLLPNGLDTEGARSTFGLLAARAAEKLGLPLKPLPKPTEHYPHWRLYCDTEEELERLGGRTIDLSDAVPHGLGQVDRDALDPCTRAWLELLRRDSPSFRISATGWSIIRDRKLNSSDGTIKDVCSASAVYCARRARDEIGARLMKRPQADAQAAVGIGCNPTEVIGGQGAPNRFLGAFPEPHRTLLEGELRIINSKLIEREIDKDRCFRDSFDIFANALVNSEHGLPGETLLERIPVLVFETALEFNWISREEAEWDSFYWSGPFKYGNPPPIPAPAASLGNHTVQEAFRTWFLARIEGRIGYWRGVALKQSAERSIPSPDATRLSMSRAPGVSKSGKKGGRRGDADRRSAIQKVIRAHGDRWRDHLSEIFAELANQEVRLGDFQTYKIDLGDGKSCSVAGWVDLDLAEGEQRGQIIDVLRKYTD
jgi:hypothetical protein